MSPLVLLSTKTEIIIPSWPSSWAYDCGRMIVGVGLWAYDCRSMVLGVWSWAYGFGCMVLGV